MIHSSKFLLDTRNLFSWICQVGFFWLSSFSKKDAIFACYSVTSINILHAKSLFFKQHKKKTNKLDQMFYKYFRCELFKCLSETVWIQHTTKMCKYSSSYEYDRSYRETDVNGSYAWIMYDTIQMVQCYSGRSCVDLIT